MGFGRGAAASVEASFLKICVQRNGQRAFRARNNMTSYLAIDLRCLAAAHRPLAVDDNKGHTVHAFPPRFSHHRLDLVQALV